MKKGANDISALYLGSTEIEKAYLGVNPIYEKGGGGGGIDEYTQFLLHLDGDAEDSSTYHSVFNPRTGNTLNFSDGGKFGKFLSTITHTSSYGISWEKPDSSVYFSASNGTGGFTYEYFAKPNLSGEFFMPMSFKNKSNSATSTYINPYIKNGHYVFSYSIGGMISGTSTDSLDEYITSDWNHICLQYKPGYWYRAYINGHLGFTYTGNKTDLQNWSESYSQYSNYISYSPTNGQHCGFDEFRFSNIVRYNEDGFTPPTEPYN